MENGQVVEYGPPRELCDQGAGILSSLIDETGPSSAERLRKYVSMGGGMAHEDKNGAIEWFFGIISRVGAVLQVSIVVYTF